MAIVKERREAKRETHRWKERALEAEAELRSLKASIEGRPIDEGFLKQLTELEELTPERHPPHSAIDDVRDRRTTFSIFLKNVHALRAAQVLL